MRGREAASRSAPRTLQTTVEAPTPEVRLIRLAGRLDRAAAASVLRLVDVQLELITARYRTVTDLVIDIGDVGTVEPVGLSSLRHAAYSTSRRGVGLYISGCGGRVHLLPLRSQQLLAQFRTFPTAELALQTLADATTWQYPTTTASSDRAISTDRLPQQRPPVSDLAGSVPRPPQ